MNGKRNVHKKVVGLISAAIVLLSIVTAVMGITPVGAVQVAWVNRSLPISVAPNEQFTVTLTQSGFGLDTGLVWEVLPQDFEYVNGSYTGGAPDWVTYDPATRTLQAGFLMENSISYDVKASSYAQTAVFGGTYKTLVNSNNIWQDERGNVTGKSTVNVVVTPTPTPTPTPDITSPAAITNLATSNPTTTTIDLSWTAPGDDDNTGTAAVYDIRYLEGAAVTDANWATAMQVAGVPAPQVAGSSETFTVTGLAASTTYYFAMKTADEVPNWSPISNSPSETTTMAVICFEIDFATGYNMISMPVNDPAVVTASTLANEVGISCTEIVRWDSATQSYVSFVPSVPLNNFAIEGGMGYLVNLNNPTPDVLFCNSGWASPFAISLLTGYNMIGIPVNDSSVTNASTLAAKVGGNCTEVVMWDSATQSFVSFIPGVPLNNFTTGGGAGYLVNVNNPTMVAFTGTPWQN